MTPGRAKLLIVVLLLFAFLTIAATPVPKTRAWLASGPTPGRGIPFLGLNTWPHAAAQYRWEDKTVSIYFTREPLRVPTTWEELRCQALRYRGRVVSGNQLLWLSGPGWIVMVRAPEGTALCGFVGALAKRIKEIEASPANRDPWPLPAMLEW